MQLRSVIRALLLGLCGVSLAVWAFRTVRDAGAGADAASTQSGAGSSVDERVLDDGVAVINFHGTRRCDTCLTIGRLAQDVTESGFGDHLRAGRLQWRSIDFDEPRNRHYKDDYDLYASNVVVVVRAGGRDVAWNRLDDVWTHVQDDPAFRAYVTNAIEAALVGLPQ